MSVFDERPVLPAATNAASKKFRLRELLGVILLIGVILVITHRPHHLQQSLQEFRGESPADSGPNISMDSSLAVRRFLLTRPSPKLSTHQSDALTASVAGPANDQAQSEALDVLSLAQRAHALSAAQARQAGLAALSVLQHSPGPMVRLESARLLGHLGDRASLPALLVLQQDSDPKVREAAGQALMRVQK